MYIVKHIDKESKEEVEEFDDAVDGRFAPSSPVLQDFPPWSLLLCHRKVS